MRYTVSMQNQSGFPVMLVFMFMAIIVIVFGFFLRGLLSFFLPDAAFLLIQLIDWLLMAALFGFMCSLVGVLAGGLFFLYKLRQLVKRSQQQMSKSEYEYNAEFRRINHDET